MIITKKQDGTIMISASRNKTLTDGVDYISELDTSTIEGSQAWSEIPQSNIPTDYRVNQVIAQMNAEIDAIKAASRAVIPERVGFTVEWNDETKVWEYVADTTDENGTADAPFVLDAGLTLIPNAYYTYNDVRYVYMGAEKVATEDDMPTGDTEVDYGKGWTQF